MDPIDRWSTGFEQALKALGLSADDFPTLPFLRSLAAPYQSVQAFYSSLSGAGRSCDTYCNPLRCGTNMHPSWPCSPCTICREELVAQRGFGIRSRGRDRDRGLVPRGWRPSLHVRVHERDRQPFLSVSSVRRLAVFVIERCVLNARGLLCGLPAIRLLLTTGYPVFQSILQYAGPKRGSKSC